MTDQLVPPFMTKIVIAVRDDLPTWQRLNVTAFLAGGIAAATPELVGEPYFDADTQPYLPLIGMPVVVFEGSIELLQRARARLTTRGLPVGVFTSEMFSTGHDGANRAVVAGVAGPDLELAGIAAHGPKNAIDKAIKGMRLHP